MLETDSIHIYRYTDQDGSTTFGYDIGDTDYITALGLVEAFKQDLIEDYAYSEEEEE